MNQDTSRKRFLSKVLGLAAIGTFAPKAVAHAVVPASTNKVHGNAVAFRLSPQPRAVARTQG